MPTLRQLEYLVAIADLQNFRRAADACHISQPSLSQQVRALEDRLGVVLVERRASGAELTPIGREITAVRQVATPRPCLPPTMKPPLIRSGTIKMHFALLSTSSGMPLSGVAMIASRT